MYRRPCGSYMQATKSGLVNDIPSPPKTTTTTKHQHRLQQQCPQNVHEVKNDVAYRRPCGSYMQVTESGLVTSPSPPKNANNNNNKTKNTNIFLSSNVHIMCMRSEIMYMMHTKPCGSYMQANKSSKVTFRKQNIYKK